MIFPNFDPIAFSIGPLAVHWYGLAYVAGILGWWRYSVWLNKYFKEFDRKFLDDFIVWAIIGVILGGRLGYVLFYKPSYFAAHLWEIPQTWRGGMAFHGGLLGVLIATYFFCKSRKKSFLSFTDLACCGVPIGLFFGRIANFINGELYGRITDHSLGVIFPQGGPWPRHPSQLYEASLEGMLLFILLGLGCVKFNGYKKQGLLTGIFFLGYGISRFVVEYLREPDAFMGFLFGHYTMGQLLSLPMICLGLYLAIKSFFIDKQKK